MPQPYSPTPPRAAAIRAPICETCETPMRLVRVEPHHRYTNLDEWTYTCTCGATASHFVAHKS
jgi:hypothetical protein